MLASTYEQQFCLSAHRDALFKPTSSGAATGHPLVPEVMGTTPSGWQTIRSNGLKDPALTALQHCPEPTISILTRDTCITQPLRSGAGCAKLFGFAERGK